MRILQINSAYKQSGAGKIVACIHHELKNRGYTSFVTYGRGKDSCESEVFKFGSKLETQFEGLNSRLLGLHGFTVWHGTKELIERIDELKPDILHLHGLHGYYLNLSILFNYINANDLPCVWTFHDCLAFTGNCGYYYNCEKWKTGCRKCPRIKDYPKSMLFDFTEYMWKKKKELFTVGDRKVIVSPSQWMTNNVIQSFFSKYESITINNGIDNISTFYPRDKNQSRTKHGFSEKDKIILAVSIGFKDSRKGIKYIFRLAKAFENFNNYKIVVIGLNKEDFDHLDYSNIIAYPKTSNQDELAEFYSLADVFVLTSLEENYATVILESMACGTPVVGFDVGGTPEQVSYGKGIVVEAGNTQLLYEAVIKVVEKKINLKSRDELTAYIDLNNSIKAMVDQYEMTYKRLLKDMNEAEGKNFQLI